MANVTLLRQVIYTPTKGTKCNKIKLQRRQEFSSINFQEQVTFGMLEFFIYIKKNYT